MDALEHNQTATAGRAERRRPLRVQPGGREYGLADMAEVAGEQSKVQQQYESESWGRRGQLEAQSIQSIQLPIANSHFSAIQSNPIQYLSTYGTKPAACPLPLPSLGQPSAPFQPTLCHDRLRALHSLGDIANKRPSPDAAPSHGCWSTRQTRARAPARNASRLRTATGPRCPILARLPVCPPVRCPPCACARCQAQQPSPRPGPILSACCQLPSLSRPSPSHLCHHRSTSTARSPPVHALHGSFASSSRSFTRFSSALFLLAGSFCPPSHLPFLVPRHHATLQPRARLFVALPRAAVC